MWVEGKHKSRKKGKQGFKKRAHTFLFYFIFKARLVNTAVSNTYHHYDAVKSCCRNNNVKENLEIPTTIGFRLGPKRERGEKCFAVFTAGCYTSCKT